MKLTKIIMGAMVAGMMAFAANQGQAGGLLTQFPLVRLNVSGAITFSENITTNNGTVTKGSPLKQQGFNTKTLIKLLNASPAFVTALTNQFGASSNQVPAGSYIVWNIGTSSLIITNKNGFSFILNGFGSLSPRTSALVGTFTRNDSTGAGNESDRTGVLFFFRDQNGYEVECYGAAILNWTYGPVVLGVQKTTVSAAMSGKGYFGEVNFHIGAPTFNAGGSGTGTDPSFEFPYYQF